MSPDYSSHPGERRIRRDTDTHEMGDGHVSPPRVHRRYLHVESLEERTFLNGKSTFRRHLTDGSWKF